jgi:mono/diheme cytochrome c family protein
MKVTAIAITFLFFIATSFVPNQTKPAGGLKAAMERGKKVYETYCLACHQPDGTGVPNLNPPLVKTKWVLGDKKQLAKIVLKGLKGGEIDIDGDQFHNPMPPQESVLSDQEIADVLTYVRNSFGNKASLVTVAEVKTVRATSK